MSVKSILKKLLGIYYKLELNKLKKNEKVIVGENNILTNGFNVQFRNVKEPKKCLSIGSNTILGCKIIFERDKGHVIIGDRTSIGKGTSLMTADCIEIGNDVLISWDVSIYDHNSHSIYWEERKNDIAAFMEEYKNDIANAGNGKDWSNIIAKKIKIEDKVWIGFGATILKGVTLGEGCIVGSKSVVVKDVEPYTIVGGNPAKVIKKIEKNIK